MRFFIRMLFSLICILYGILLVFAIVNDIGFGEFLWIGIIGLILGKFGEHIFFPQSKVEHLIQKYEQNLKNEIYESIKKELIEKYHIVEKTQKEGIQTSIQNNGEHAFQAEMQRGYENELEEYLEPLEKNIDTSIATETTIHGHTIYDTTADEIHKGEELSQKETNKNKENKQEKSPSLFENIRQTLYNFFAQNFIAKMGGIFITIGIIFFLALDNAFGPVLKFIIGCIFGFSYYIIGTILYKKTYKTEGSVLMGVGILALYILILRAKHILGIFDDITAFVFLILNTIFSVFTAFLYGSYTLLLFSFVFSYTIPFLVFSTTTNSPYFLLGYACVLFIGQILTVHFFFQKEENKRAFQVLFMIYICANILFLLAPYTLIPSHSITKFITFYTFLFGAFFLLSHHKKYNAIPYIFGIGIIFLSFFLLGQLLQQMKGGFMIDMHPESIIIGTGLVLYIIFTTLWYKTPFTFFQIFFSLFIGIFGIGLYMLLFFQNILAFLYKEALFSLDVPMSFVSLFTLLITTFSFGIYTYVTSLKNNLLNLFPLINTLITLTLFPSIQETGSPSLVFLSILGSIIFTIMHFAYIHIASRMVTNGNTLSLSTLSLGSYITGNIISVLFILTLLLQFCNIYFPGISTGVILFIFSLVYLSNGIPFIQKFVQKSQAKEMEKNTAIFYIYTSQYFLWMSAFLIIISLNLLFWETKAIIPIILFLTSNIFLYFSKTLHEKTLYFLGAVFLGIGTTYYWFVHTFNGILGLFIIFIIIMSLTLNIFIFHKKEFSSYNPIALLHFIGIIISFVKIGNNTGFPDEINVFFMILITSCLYIIYIKLQHIILQKAIFFVFVVLSFIEAGIILDIPGFPLFEILSILLFIGTIIYAQSQHLPIALKYQYSLLGSISFFVLTTLLVQQVSDNTFFVTLYWGILGFFIIHFGIATNMISLRAYGAIIIIFTIIKILFFDIFVSFGNHATRVFAFFIVGIIFIYLHTLYKKAKTSIKDDVMWILGNQKKE